MSENQLIDHRDESCLDGVVPDVFHGAAALVLNVGSAAPCRVFACSAGVYPALKSVATFAADDFAGEAVTALVFFAAFDDAFFSAALCNQCVCRIKDLAADNGFVVIGHCVLVLLAVIDMPVELRIGVSLLEDHIAGVFLVADHAAHCSRRPASALFGGDTVIVQFFRDGVGAFARKNLIINLLKCCRCKDRARGRRSSRRWIYHCDLRRKR